MQPLPLPEWDESLGRVIDDMDGRPLNVHALMANNPELLDAWWDFRNYSVRGGHLEQRDCELVVLRVAVRMHSWYEWASHVDRGLAAGLTPEEIERIRLGAPATEWEERDAMLLATVDDLFNERAINPNTLGILSEYFSKQQILDIIAIHGMYVTLGGIINTWAVELDEDVGSRLPEDFTRDAFESDVGNDE